MCVHVCSCAFACILLSVSVCVCTRVLLPHSISESCIADSLQAGWPAICFLFYFIIIFFLTIRTHKHGEPLLTKATPLGCIKMNRVLFNDLSRELLSICKLAWVSFLLLFFWPSSRAEHCQVQKSRRAGGTSWSNCVFIYFCFLKYVATRHIWISVKFFFR